MQKSIMLITLLFLAQVTFTQKDAFVIYNAKGKKVSYKKMLKTLIKQDIVLFGEHHDNAISHWLEYEMSLIPPLRDYDQSSHPSI